MHHPDLQLCLTVLGNICLPAAQCLDPVLLASFAHCNGQQQPWVFHVQLTELNLERNKMTREKVNLENQLEAEQEYILNKLHKQVCHSWMTLDLLACWGMYLHN